MRLDSEHAGDAEENLAVRNATVLQVAVHSRAVATDEARGPALRETSSPHLESQQTPAFRHPAVMLAKVSAVKRQRDGTCESTTLQAMRERLKELRNRRGWSQRDLAEKSGVDPATIGKLESGERDDIKASTLFALARALEVSMDQVYEAEDLDDDTKPIGEREVLDESRNPVIDAVGARRGLSRLVIGIAQASIPAGRGGVVVTEELASQLLDGAVEFERNQGAKLELAALKSKIPQREKVTPTNRDFARGPTKTKR